MHISLITSAVTKRRERQAQWSTKFSFFLFHESCCCLWNNINSIFWWTKINNSECEFFAASWLQIKWVKIWSYKALSLSLCMMLLLKFTLICIRFCVLYVDDDDEGRNIHTCTWLTIRRQHYPHSCSLRKERVHWRIFP